MRTILKIFPFALGLVLFSWDEDALLPSTFNGQDALSSTKVKDKVDSYKATGDVEVTFMSNPGGHENGNHSSTKEGTQKFAHVVFNAHEGDLKKEAKGSVEITMMNKEGVVKRTFIADVYEVKVDPLSKEARFLALVISDVRSDEGHSDHDESGDEHDGQGGSGGGNHSDDGESHDDSSHDDSSHDDSSHGGGGHSDDTDRGNKSRIGQSIGVKVYDGGSPGTNGDTIGWKWFAGNNPNTPSLEDHGQWRDMCDKEILAGNLVVHIN